MILRCALLTVSLACTALAGEDIAAVAQDPHLLAEYINTHANVDLAPLRAFLGVNDSAVFLPPCELEECRAEVLEVPDAKPVQAILWGSHKSSGFAFWLRYRRNAQGVWSFWAAVPVNVKYFGSEHRLATIFGRPFFVVDEQGMAGTGLSSKYETRFDLSLPGAKPALGFTKQGTARGWPFPFVHTVDVKASSLKHGDTEEIRLDYAVHFEAEPNEDGPPFELGRATATAYFVRQDTGEFKPSPPQSTAPKSVLDSIFDIQDVGMTCEQFLKFDIANLRRIASTPQSAEAKWLAEFLQTCKPSPQKSELLRLLN